MDSTLAFLWQPVTAPMEMRFAGVPVATMPQSGSQIRQKVTRSLTAIRKPSLSAAERAQV